MNTAFTAHSKCRLCDSGNIEEVLDLGYSPLANAYLTAEQLAEVRTGKREEIFTPLRLFLCMDCGSVQLAHSVDPKILFTDYIYASSTSPVFVKHFEELAWQTWNLWLVRENDLVVDIGSNDGIGLSPFKVLQCRVVGVEPSQVLAEMAIDRGFPIIQSFFSTAVAKDIVASQGKAKVITACNVFAHLSDLRGFMDGVDELLADDGVFIFENSYLGDVVDKMLFDTIYMEHQFYHSIAPLAQFFLGMDMRIFRVERIDTHGGSIRVFVDRGQRDIYDVALDVLDYESDERLCEPATYRQFGDRLQCYKHRLHSVLRPWGQDVLAYGCPAKFTTFCYALGLETKFPFVVDDSPLKTGHFTPGSHVPILSRADAEQYRLFNAMPLAVVTAWNFFDSIIANQGHDTPLTRRWLRPLPNLEVVNV